MAAIWRLPIHTVDIIAVLGAERKGVELEVELQLSASDAERSRAAGLVREADGEEFLDLFRRG
jgi:hypothetical protein